MADTMQQYESLALIASAITGGGDQNGSSLPAADPSAAPKSADQLEAMLGKALG